MRLLDEFKTDVTLVCVLYTHANLYTRAEGSSLPFHKLSFLRLWWLLNVSRILDSHAHIFLIFRIQF
jgi:hypothetical protein